jgi:hypothetical protein
MASVGIQSVNYQSTIDKETSERIERFRDKHEIRPSVSAIIRYLVVKGLDAIDKEKNNVV